MDAPAKVSFSFDASLKQALAITLGFICNEKQTMMILLRSLGLCRKMEPMGLLHRLLQISVIKSRASSIIITQRFYRQLITSLKVIANFSNMSNLMKDDVMSGATDNVE